MPDLTQQEKDRIRHEMEYREYVARQLAPGSSKLAKVFAHPAMVTVIGGMLIAGITALFQFMSAIQQQRLTHAEQLRGTKFALLSTFTERFHRDGTVLVNLQLEGLWLTHHGSEDKYLGVASRQEIMARYQKLAEEYIKQDQASALLAQVQALFDDPDIQTEATALDRKIETLETMPTDELSDADSQKQILQLGTQLEEGMRRLAKAMAHEIKL